MLCLSARVGLRAGACTAILVVAGGGERSSESELRRALLDMSSCCGVADDEG